jgi:choline monooxygenase
MTENAAIALAARLPVPQLPVSWYFDEKLFELEKKLLFAPGPGYVGHELMVPELHDYRSLEWQDHAKLLLRQEGGIDLMSNVCRHRQAIICGRIYSRSTALSISSNSRCRA